MDPIKVTILTVTYNSEETVAKAIESVLNQTYANLEYIVIDGFSTDRTVEIADSFRSRFSDKGIAYNVISEPDSGMYDALNKGIRLATGQLIGNVNSDDWYQPDAVETMVQLYNKEHYDLAWGSIYVHTKGKTRVKRAHLGKLWTTSGFCHPAMFGTRETELSYPYACCAIDDDFDMATRVYLDGKKIVVTDKIISNYVFGGMSTKRSIHSMFKRIAMKYHTYRKNKMSPLYLFYCIAIEVYKFIIG